MRRLPLLVLSLVLVITALGVVPAGATEERSWRSLDVPYLSADRIHFRGNVAPDPIPDPDFPNGVYSLTSTRHSAIVQGGRETLFELPERRGRLRKVGTDVVGLPIADPSGDWVFWTADRGRKRGVRLLGYDTRLDRLRRGPVLARDARVWAVEGDTAYAGLAYRRVVRWTPGDRPRRLPGRLARAGLLAGVHQSRYAVNGSNGPVVLDGAGHELARWSGDRRASYTSFDPTGRYLADLDGAVWDSIDGTTTKLRTGRRWSPTYFRWTPGGELVVTGVWLRGEWTPRTPARRFVCDPATGACDPLPNPRGVRRYTVGHEPLDNSAATQSGLLF